MQINRTEKNIFIRAEYNKEFVTHARNLGGIYTDNKGWKFDIRDEADVLEACYLAYGDDGVRVNQCDVKVTLPNNYYAYCDAIYVFGREIARAWGRDSGVKVAAGIVIKSGGFDSGGSAKNWCTQAKEGTIFIVRDVSRPLVEMEMGVENEKGITFEIMETSAAPMSRLLEDEPYIAGIPASRRRPVMIAPSTEELIEERDYMLSRLAKINALLGK